MIFINEILNFVKVQLQSNVCYALHNGDEIKFGDIICSFQEQKQIDVKFLLNKIIILFFENLF